LAKQFIAIYSICSLLFPNTEQININNADYESIMSLPLDDINNKELIYEFMIVHGQIDNIYDLLLIPSITATDINQLKSSIFVEKIGLSNISTQLEANSYDYGSYLGEDGNMKNASNYWLDMILYPEDINSMGYYDLINLPILSPMDVSAVLMKKNSYEIKSNFDLKNADGITRYGMKNLEKFITYPENIDSSIKNNTRIHIDINTRPRASGSDSESIEFENANASIPEVYTTIRSNFGNQLITGVSYYRTMGQPLIKQIDFNKNKSTKAYISLENIEIGNSTLDKLIIGNFTASYGQGIVFENSDEFRSRKTGYGWTKRPNGLMPDDSKTTQFTLRGIGAQFSNSYINFSGFGSYSPRDAIINSDGSFASFITLYPRLGWGLTGDSTLFNNSLINSVNEITYGGHIDMFPMNKLRFGTTFYESLYDRVLHAEDEYILETIIEDDYKFHEPGNADAEISAMYSSNGKSNLWDKAKSYRRVLGFDFTYILENIIFQGEYGELSSDQDMVKIGNEPAAWILNSYFKFDKLDLLVLYRDYDLEFDNAYQRSFSNYARFKNTLFSYDYRLIDPIYSYLHFTNAQPQSEKGFYIYSRYEFHRNFLATLDWDTWTRVADKARYYRIRGSLKYSPIFNYSIKISQKFQGKSPFNIFSKKNYFISETNISAKLKLSNYNNITLSYLINRFYGSPRPSLTDHYDGSDYGMQVGDAGSPETSFGVSFTHHFDNKSTLSSAVYLIDGYFLNTGAGDFRIFSDSNQILFTNISADVWVTQTLKLNFKFSRTLNNVLTNATGVYSEGADVDNDPTINYPTIHENSTDFTLQVDYVF